MCGGTKKLAYRPVPTRENTLLARQQARDVATKIRVADAVRARRERKG